MDSTFVGAENMVHADLVHLVAAILKGIELESWSNQSWMTFNRGFSIFANLHRR